MSSLHQQARSGQAVLRNVPNPDDRGTKLRYLQAFVERRASSDTSIRMCSVRQLRQAAPFAEQLLSFTD